MSTHTVHPHHDVMRGAFVVAALVTLGSNAYLLPRISEDGAGAALDASWWVGAQVAVGFGYVVLRTSLSQGGVDVRAGTVLERARPAWRARTDWPSTALAGVCLLALVAGALVPVVLDGFAADYAAAAVLGTVVLQGWGGLVGWCAAYLVVQPLVVLVRASRWHPDDVEERLLRRWVVLVSCLVWLITPFSVCLVAGQRTLGGSRAGLSPLLLTGGPTVVSQGLLWVARGALVLMVVCGVRAVRLRRRLRADRGEIPLQGR